MLRNKNYNLFRPEKQGLYDPSNEHDSCGLGFVANFKGKRSHSIINDGLEMLENLEHRGAVGADKTVGDGAGILTNIPHLFFSNYLKKKGVTLPKEGDYGVGVFFLPKISKYSKNCINLIEKQIRNNNLEIIYIRKVPTNSKILSPTMRKSEPHIFQIFIKSKKEGLEKEKLYRKLFVLGKLITNEINLLIKQEETYKSFYISSLSNRTIVYKGMLLSDLVRKYFPDLSSKNFVSSFSLIHQRFSTNTFPSWDLAQPFRMVCHNGEINTVRGNVNWINARKHTMESNILGKDLKKIWPIIPEGQSDTACFDNALELLIMGGYSLAHAMMLLIPEAWQNSTNMDENKKAFYQYYSTFSEPWDGPAAVAFSDGKQIGATLDRNGLRPARYFITNDDRIILASEMGVLRVPEEKIVEKFRLRPGKMLLVDLEKGEIIKDDNLKKEKFSAVNYKKLIKSNFVVLKETNKKKKEKFFDIEALKKRQNFFGYTQEDIKFLLSPMVANSAEATGSMGTDTPVAVLSQKSKLLFNYFKQNFAQVTNPAIDPIREEAVMSLISYLGERANILNLELDNKKRIKLKQPILTKENMIEIGYYAKRYPKYFSVKRINILFGKNQTIKEVKEKLRKICNN